MRLGGAISRAFGSGKVATSTDAAKGEAGVQVNVAQVGSKWLMPGYANLEMLD